MRWLLRFGALIVGFALMAVAVGIGSMIVRGVWLPIAAVFLATFVIWPTVGRRLEPVGTLLISGFGFAFFGLWSYSAAYQYRELRDPFQAFTVMGLLLIAGGLWRIQALPTGRRTASRWFAVAILAGCAIAYLSGNAGSAGPMLRWLTDLGLNPDDARAVTLVFRKVVHFTTYGFIGASMTLAARRSGILPSNTWFVGVGYGLTLACFDELRQSMTATRTPSIWDVSIDLAGMLTATVLLAVVPRLGGSGRRLA